MKLLYELYGLYRLLISKLLRALDFEAALSSFFNRKKIESYFKTVKKVDSIRSLIHKYSNEEILTLFKHIYQSSDLFASNDNNVLILCIALVREIIFRKLGLMVYDTQIVASLSLLDSNFIDMKTGEGKSLVFLLFSILNKFIKHKKSYMMTINTYLGERDLLTFLPVFQTLGMSAFVLNETLPVTKKQILYEHYDVLYGTARDYVFDYLHNFLGQETSEFIHFQHHNIVLCIDEVDSICIDSNTIPFIVTNNEVSHELPNNIDIYSLYKFVDTTLKIDFDYIIEVQSRKVTLSDSTIQKLENLLSVDSIMLEANSSLIHFLFQCISAKECMVYGRDYIVNSGKVKVLDRETGRILENTSFSDGLQQALEAKSNVAVTETYGICNTISLISFLRRFPGQVIGMSGTAVYSIAEFNEEFNAQVLQIPTHRRNRRIERSPIFFRDQNTKLNYLINLVKTCKRVDRPVLICAANVVTTEKIYYTLLKNNLNNTLLTAENAELEDEVISYAGVSGHITSSTNMSGRGTDIKLGGNLDYTIRKIRASTEYSEEEKEIQIQKLEERRAKDRNILLRKGGLLMILFEFNRNHRSDEQMIGRTARQGEPGESMILSSPDDDVFNNTQPVNYVSSLYAHSGSGIKSVILHSAILEIQDNNELIEKQARQELEIRDGMDNIARDFFFALLQDLILHANDISNAASIILKHYMSRRKRKFVTSIFGINMLVPLRLNLFIVKTFYPITIAHPNCKKNLNSNILKLRNFVLSRRTKAELNLNFEIPQSDFSLARQMLLSSVLDAYSNFIYTNTQVIYKITGVSSYLLNERYRHYFFTLNQTFDEYLDRTILYFFTLLNVNNNMMNMVKSS